MRNPTGQITIVDPSAPTVERDTFTCKHCQRIVAVDPMKDPAESGGFCRICWGLVCKQCNLEGTCSPWERQMEQIEARDRFRRSAGLDR
jgi:hypothetical protein